MNSINSNKISLETFCYKKTNIELHVTLYRSTKKTTRATLLYFHGGGLLYGKRTDLPKYHIDTFCDEGYSILAFDYRLAPVTKLPHIMDDVKDAITWYLSNRTHLFYSKVPLFLMGKICRCILMPSCWKDGITRKSTWNSFLLWLYLFSRFLVQSSKSVLCTISCCR